MTSNTSHTATPVPCPPWCREDPAHVDGVDPDGTIRRTHTWEVHVLRLGGTLGDRTDEAGVQVQCFDETDPLTGATRGEPARLSIWGHREGTPMTAAQARHLAGALLDAADRLDELTGDRS